MKFIRAVLMSKAAAFALWTGLLSVLFFCVGFLAISRAQTPRGIERPLAVVDDLDPDVMAKRIAALTRRVDSLMSGHDLLKKDFDAFRKDTDARLLKSTPSLSAVEDLPEIVGFTPSWFACPWCEVAKKESEDPNLPFRVVWSEVTEKQLKELGIPADARFPCFYWTDSKGKPWYAYSFGEGNPRETRMQGLERKWREHR